ncbi:hypothetical protein BKA70DRAFT_1224750 [Coprinopsis sp. MPI-PUGE-AT-0042]|nr:hypothetical protein BKA70DRAFT_1224750 [Coprinopsis sp. MPI-PUGE-AT-0042]
MKVYKVFQNVPQLKKILKALKDLTHQLQSRARGNFTPKAKSVGVPGWGRIDHRTAGKRHHILDCDSMRGRLWELCSKPKVSRVPTWAFTNDFGTRPASGPAPQSRAREVRPKSEVGRGAGSWSGSDRQTAGKRYHMRDRVRRPECADTSATESARPVCSGSDSAGNAITRFRAGPGPLESY